MPLIDASFHLRIASLAGAPAGPNLRHLARHRGALTTGSADPMPMYGVGGASSEKAVGKVNNDGLRSLPQPAKADIVVMSGGKQR